MFYIFVALFNRIIKEIIMITRTFVIRMLLSSMIWIVTLSSLQATEAKNIELYTTNTKISIPPGESIDYSIDVINQSEETKYCNLRVTGIPSSWNYSLTSGAYNIQQIALQPGDKKMISLKIEAPLKVNKGNYKIVVHAGSTSLPLIVNISKQGSYTTEFTTDQPNMEGHTKSHFSFRAKVKNRTGEKQLYALKSNAPRGWQVIFKPNNQQATAIEIEPNSAKDISIEVKPPQNAPAGTYKIPISADNNSSSAYLELEVVITGTYELELTTPMGLVSTKITAGSEKNLELIVRNTGSATLTDIKLSASKPSGWDAIFEPAEITSLEPGQQSTVNVKLKAGKKAIAGDYITTYTARIPETSSNVAFRVAVKTPALWGWIGILVIFAAFGIVIYLFRKYGRR
jgi:uncharacterized membrane protein